MELTAKDLVDICRHLASAVRFDDLTRTDWRRQTDCVQQSFITARLFTDLGSRAIFIDGHIHDYLKIQALAHPQGVKAFFNRRFHDLCFKARRLIFFDTRMTRKMGQRGAGRYKLHFHALIELPAGWSQAALLRVLERVFGKAKIMGRRQFHIPPPDWTRHYTHNDVRITGPLGKLAYVMAHAGTSYRDLDLNDGKRSRSTPKSRGRYNRQASGLARGIPSNFNADIVLIDAVSKRAGKQAFEAWIKAERATRRSAPTPQMAQPALTPTRQKAS